MDRSNISPLTLFSEVSDDDLISMKYMASVLDCAHCTIRRMIQRKQLPKPIKLGNQHMWHVGNLKTYIQKRFHEVSHDQTQS